MPFKIWWYISVFAPAFFCWVLSTPVICADLNARALQYYNSYKCMPWFKILKRLCFIVIRWATTDLFCKRKKKFLNVTKWTFMDVKQSNKMKNVHMPLLLYRIICRWWDLTVCKLSYFVYFYWTHFQKVARAVIFAIHYRCLLVSFVHNSLDGSFLLKIWLNLYSRGMLLY